MEPVSIDVVSDVVCPWCLIGSRNLELALEGLPDVPVRVTFRPFLLDPSAPPEGSDLRDHLRRKYGDPEPMFRRVEQVARAAGIPLDFQKVRRFVPTLRAHTLARAAIEKGTQRALVRSLFEAYFLEGRDPSAMDVLIDVGGRHGFERAELLALLEDPAALAATRAEARQAAEEGITGVPFTIVGESLALSGAQPPAAFRQAIERAVAARPG